MTYAPLGESSEPQEYGKIVASDGWSYQLTTDDILWIARSVEFEGGLSPSGVIWTYAQRLALPNIHSLYPTLASLVRAYSQPVNPKWARDGVFCAPGGSYAGKPECSESKLTRRDRAQSIPWGEISARTRSLVTKFARAELPNPVPRSVGFADAHVSTGFLASNPAAQVILRAGNWFIGTAQSLAWPAGHVRVQFRGMTSGETTGGASIVLVLLLAAAGGALAWWRWRS